MNIKQKNIIEKIRPYYNKHPFAHCNLHKNLFRDINGNVCGFRGYFPHLCDIAVTKDGSVMIIVEHDSYEAHAMLIFDGVEFTACKTKLFDGLSRSEQDTIDRICDDLKTVLND